jgi:hypothetical protein
MKYLKLWKYALCPFYVNFAPYVVISALIFNIIGCTDNAEEKAYQRIKTENERRDNCQELAQCLGAEGNLGYSQEDQVWVCAIFRKGSPHIFQGFRESSLPAAIRSCNLKGEIKNETCKFPRTKKSEKDSGTFKVITK